MEFENKKKYNLSEQDFRKHRSHEFDLPATYIRLNIQNKSKILQFTTTKKFQQMTQCINKLWRKREF